MKRTEILPTLEQLLKNAPFTLSNTYKVCWLDSKLDVISAACPRQPEIVFGIVHKSELREGLTSAKWNYLEGGIVAFMTQKGYL